MQAFQREAGVKAGEGWFELANDCDSHFRRLSAMRCWPALRGGLRALEPSVCAAEAPTWPLSLHGHVERACQARPKAWLTAERRSDRLRLTNDDKPRSHERGRPSSGDGRDPTDLAKKVSHGTLSLNGHSSAPLWS